MSGLCPNHGPFDGNVCTYPPPHGDDGRPGKPSLDDAATELGARGRRYDSGEEPTEMPKKRILDEDDDGDVTTDYGGLGDDVLDKTQLENPLPPMLAMLWVTEGRRPGKTYPVNDETTVGRQGCSIVLDDVKVSKTHAKFKMNGDDFVIWDLATTNGTFVNGKKINKATVLQENDLIRIGETTFSFRQLISRNKQKEKNSRTSSPKKPVAKEKPAKK